MGFWPFGNKKSSAKGIQAPDSAAMGTDYTPVPDKEQVEADTMDATDSEPVRRHLERLLTSGDADPSKDGPPLKPGVIAEQVGTGVKRSLQSMEQFAESFERFKSFNNPNASLKDVSDAVTKDIVFSSKVLKVANSPYFGMSGKVASVHHAVTILGMDSMKTLYFNEYFKMLGGGSKKETELRNAIWNHSMTTAVIASCLAQCTRYVKKEVAFTLGLLHDVGKFVVMGLPRLDGTQEESPASELLGRSIRSELEANGIHHALAGRMAAEAWNLPPLTVRAIGLHHSVTLIDLEQYASKKKFMAHLAVLYLADQLSKLYESHFEDQDAPNPLPTGWEQFFNLDRVRSVVLDGELERELEKTKAVNS